MASTPSSPTLVFNYDISCPFAYIASTRVRALAHRTNTTLVYRPVLLGAIYRATAAPQGAGGSASDVFNSAKKAVTAKGMQHTLTRYQIKYNPPPQHPRKTVNALRLLYCVRDQAKRAVLTDALFRAYWVDGRDVNDDAVLLGIARECRIEGLDARCFEDQDARKELADATGEAIDRGAFGVPGFWIPGAGGNGQEEGGRFFWGQDRMHFVEATLRSLSCSSIAAATATARDPWTQVPNLRSLIPRCTPSNKLSNRVKLEFWFDFSSPWAFLGYTQLPRLQRTFGPQLEIVLKPFLLGILFREIGAPNLPMTAISATKAAWSRQDHADWTRWWNAIDVQEGGSRAKRKDGGIKFYWTDNFPIRTPTVLRVGIVEPEATRVLFSACWEQNKNVSDDTVLRLVLDEAGYDGADLIARANTPDIKTKLRALTAEAKELGLCGVPTYRVLRQQQEGGEFEAVGGLVWGQDEISVVEDLIAGWVLEKGGQVAEVGTVSYEDAQGGKRGGAKL